MQRWLLLALFLSLPLLAQAQSPPVVTVTLAWDYNLPATGQDGFALYRKLGQAGTYSKLGIVLTSVARLGVDSTSLMGQIYCYVVRATLGAYESANSNEVCNASLVTPFSLRVQ